MATTGKNPTGGYVTYQRCGGCGEQIQGHGSTEAASKAAFAQALLTHRCKDPAAVKNTAWEIAKHGKRTKAEIRRMEEVQPKEEE